MNAIRFVLLFFLLFLVITPPALAATPSDIDFESKTYLLVEEDPNEEDSFAPLYEYMDLDIYNLNNWGVNLHASGWGRWHMSDVPFEDEGEDRDEADLTYAYLSYIPFQNHQYGSMKIDLGRQFLFSGTTNEHFDGISGTWDVMKFLGASAYFGVPVNDEDKERYYGTSANDEADDNRLTSIVGGRVYSRLFSMAEIGVSYLKAEENNRDNSFREEWGIDLWAQPIDLIEIQGSSLFNDQTNDFMDHDYALTLFPMPSLAITGLYHSVNYEDYFFTGTLDVFSPENLGADEEMEKFGGRVNYQLTENFATALEFFKYDYEVADTSNYYGGRLSANDIIGFYAGASMHRMESDDDLLDYTAYRLYAGRTVCNFNIVIDGTYLDLDEVINEKSEAISISGNVSYQLLQSLKLSAYAEYIEDTEYDNTVKSFFSIIYKY